MPIQRRRPGTISRQKPDDNMVKHRTELSGRLRVAESDCMGVGLEQMKVHASHRPVSVPILVPKRTLVLVLT